MLDILTYFHVFVVIGLKCNKIGLFEAWDDQRKIKVAQRVQEQYLQLRIMFDVQIIELWVFELFLFLVLALALLLQALVVDLPGDVLKEQRDWSWNQVLEHEWRGDREIPHRDELRLLGVEIDVAANAVCVCI